MLLPPGRTKNLRADDKPVGAQEATIRDVAWLDAHGKATTDPDRVVEFVVAFRRDDGTPVLTAYGEPFDSD